MIQEVTTQCGGGNLSAVLLVVCILLHSLLLLFFFFASIIEMFGKTNTVSKLRSKSFCGAYRNLLFQRKAAFV